MNAGNSSNAEKHLLVRIGYWIPVWFLLTISICIAGAIGGGMLFPVAGSLLRMDLTVRQMFLNGLFDGGFLALIWAPGGSIVICFLLAFGKGINSASSGG